MLLHCISKLYRLPISVQHLQETGVGRTVNGLRKFDGEVGVAAKALVTKWKAMVADEESDEGTEKPDESHENSDSNHDGDGDCVEEDQSDELHLEVDEHQENENDIDELHENDPEDRNVQINGHDSTKCSPSGRYRIQTSAPECESNYKQQDATYAQNKTESRNSSHKRSFPKDHNSRTKDRSEGRQEEHVHHHSTSDNKSRESSSSKRTYRHGDKEKKEKYSKDSKTSRNDSSPTCEREGSHGRNKTRDKSNSKHHSAMSKTSHVENYKRQRTLEGEDDLKPKKYKTELSDKPDSSCSGNSSQHRSCSSKSNSSSRRGRDKEKKSLEKNKKHASKIACESVGGDSVNDSDGDDGLDGAAGASFADALAMIGMPSSSKKKPASKKNADKIKNSPISMPPPATKSSKEKLTSSSSNRDSFSPSSTASSSGYSSCSSTPTLLAQKSKLEPLPEISEIVESLPIISPHYKPMPLNQTVMECVFSNSGRPQKRVLSEEEALGHSMQSKNLRTKVYSGVKNSKEGVPKLFDMCIRLLQENIDLIDTFGGIPFDLLKPVIERATAQQLMKLEQFNPYLLEDTDVLWEQHCRRTFRNQMRKQEECESWREMYIRCSEERNAKLISLTQNIKQSIVEKATPVRKTKLAYVDSNAKPPRNVLSKQVKYGTDRVPVVSPAARVAALKTASANLAKVGDSRLKIAPGTRDNAQVQVFHPLKPKKAPLMAKLMTSIKGFKTGFRR
ncbi:transcription elongation factor B polypeptide 3 isoform X2 [Wyeomyia smithii]|uniref:transcription elongation factor B polypeptide 3 isoform X2 n=1 Tax=Wyeomyia smithii TaxID=174621 RepID=UPI002467CF69|nr:transcription elongation factor B polypeptide 3 isoform X2 [Wyeomyia smithii]